MLGVVVRFFFNFFSDLEGLPGLQVLDVQLLLLLVWKVGISDFDPVKTAYDRRSVPPPPSYDPV